MSSSTLKVVLKEYEAKKSAAEMDAENRKQALYSSHKRLQEIDEELNQSGFFQMKSILNQNSSQENFYKKVEALKQEKEQILASLHLPSDYLEPNYECSICKDTGYVTENYRTTLCNCIKQKLFNLEYNKSNVGNLSKENFETFDLQRFSDKADKDKFKSDLSPRENIVNIKKICETFIRNFDDENEKNLLFTGNTGLRKDLFV